MKIAIIGAGAMGSIIGGKLAQSGEDVTLIDVWKDNIDAINNNGLGIEDKAGNIEKISVRATTDPASVGAVDLALVFVKCYHTEEAVRNAAPLIGDQTTVMTLQNGWGNAPRITSIIGEERLMVGLTYHGGTMVGPGHAKHTGQGMTFMGELTGEISPRLNNAAEAFRKAGFDVTVTAEVLKEIWSKLALNVCTLPTAAMLRFTAEKLVEHDGSLDLMRALLREVVAVANAQGIPLSYNERWEAITGLLKKAVGGKASMLQDVEKSRQTEIDVINGAIVEAGKRLHIPTPHNDAMVWLVKALQETF